MVGNLRSVTTGQVRARFEGKTAPIHALTVSPDGSLLATHHLDLPQSVSEVNLWQLPSGHLWANLPLTWANPKNRLMYRPLIFSPDSRKLLAPGPFNDSPLWDISTTPPRRS